MFFRNRQDVPPYRKFPALYDGISCQFVGIEHFLQITEIQKYIAVSVLFFNFTWMKKSRQPRLKDKI